MISAPVDRGAGAQIVLLSVSHLVLFPSHDRGNAFTEAGELRAVLCLLSTKQINPLGCLHHTPHPLYCTPATLWPLHDHVSNMDVPRVESRARSCLNRFEYVE